MIELFTFAVKMVTGMVVTVSCGISLEAGLPSLPPTQERPVHYACMAEVDRGERYVATGLFYQKDRQPDLDGDNMEIEWRGDGL